VLPGKKYSPEDILHIAWQRKWLIVLPAIVIGLAAVMYTRMLPDYYRSETTILIVPTRVPESYVRSTVTSRIEDRLPSLREQILTRDRLEQTIVDFELFQDERATSSMEALVQRMRGNIKVDIVRGDAFSVSYISKSPRAAMLVAERLASQFIEENVREREVLAEGTNAFLETQLVEARSRLEQHEQKLAEYRRRFTGELPSQLDSNMQILNNLTIQAQALGNEIERDRDRRMALERSLTDITDMAPTADPGRTTVAEGPSIQDRLDAARSSLAELRTRLTAEHPDIAAARRLVSDLERQAVTRAAEEPRGPSAAPVAPAPAAALTPARQRRIQELTEERESLDRQIARKQQEVERVRTVVASYQARVEVTPARESELIALTRDYDTLQKVYASLLAKKEDSALAANLERRQIGEQFKVLEPARVPRQPFSPNRLQLNLLGILGGLAVGLGLAGLLEYRDATLKNEEDVRSCLSLPVLAAIPVLSDRRPAAAPRHQTTALGAYRFVRWLVRGEARES
jgi:polysaccharide chain length determinant protein (PEP-CTERM system associated)